MPDRYKPASTVDSRAQLGEPLTETELYIMRRLAAGAYDAEITRELSMSGRNFRRHMLAAQRKLGARTRPHAVALAAEQAARLAGRREGAPMAGGLTELRDRITEAATKWALTYPLSKLKQAEAERDALKAATDRVRRMAQVWVDIRPTYPTATGEGLAMAYAGEQILATFDRPTDRSACPRCDGAGAEPGTEEWNDIAHMHDPHTGEPCSACNGTGKAPTDTTGETGE